MRELPSCISRTNLKYWWTYRDVDGNPCAIVARYNDSGKKKRFHQFMLDNQGTWVEGARTPSPIFGIDTLPKNHYDGSVYIFEGEKCTQAAHYLGLSALTSMMGSSQGYLADWAILAGYRHIKKFILVPDRDEPGKKYMQVVADEVKKPCPNAEIFVCELPSKKKGYDLVDWVKEQPTSPEEWDGFISIDEPSSEYLRVAFEEYSSNACIDIAEYNRSISSSPVFAFDPVPIEVDLKEVLPCPVHTLPHYVIEWMWDMADQMQIQIDFFAAPFLVYILTF